jgi:hypothetical protein
LLANQSEEENTNAHCAKSRRRVRALFCTISLHGTRIHESMVGLIVFATRCDAGEPNKAPVKFTDRDVCKNFLLDMCPNELFVNTVSTHAVFVN